MGPPESGSHRRGGYDHGGKDEKCDAAAAVNRGPFRRRRRERLGRTVGVDSARRVGAGFVGGRLGGCESLEALDELGAIVAGGDSNFEGLGTSFAVVELAEPLAEAEDFDADDGV